MTTPFDQPPAWVRDAVFYQIFPDRFAVSDRVRKPGNLEPWNSAPTVHGFKGGDLLGIKEHLDWIQGLGVSAIYLNPVFQSGSNHRYHTYDYYTVDPLLGGNDALDELIAAVHDRGMRIVIDGVFNHASRGFYQFHDILENGPESPWIDWFTIQEWPLHPYDDERPANYEAWWGLKALPAFNTDHPDVREYLMRVGEHWVRKGIDGWRLDVPLEISSEGFWQEFRQRTRAVNEDLYIVAEIWHDAGKWINDGDTFDGTMNYQFTGPTIAFAVGSRVEAGQDLDNDSYDISPPLDAATYASRMRSLLDAYRMEANLANLNLLDSHDTARLRTIAGGDEASVELSLTLLLTFPGAPCIYYGTEIGLAGGKDPDCRRAFPWDQQALWSHRLLTTVKQLTAMRSEHPGLRSADMRILAPHDVDSGSMLYLCERGKDGDSLIIAVNAGEATESVSLTLANAPRELLFGEGKVEVGQNNVRFTVPSRAAAIWG